MSEVHAVEGNDGLALPAELVLGRSARKGLLVMFVNEGLRFLFFGLVALAQPYRGKHLPVLGLAVRTRQHIAFEQIGSSALLGTT